MTLKDLSHQVYTLAIGHYINDVKRTSEADVYNLFKHWLKTDYIKDYPSAKIICQITLPDGVWFIKLIRDGSYYDLYVPDTREQEQRLINELIKNCK